MRRGTFLTLATLVLVAGACQQPPSNDAASEAVEEAPPKPKPNVVLVTLDTLRADHLGCYGYMRNTSPFIDSVAAEGVVFDQAISAMSLTPPSHASLFTSLYPLQHGLTGSGIALADGFTTLAELLKVRGYQTAAFVSVDRMFDKAGLDQGFDSFNPPPDSDEAYRRADQTIDAALEWFDALDTEKPFFAWIHVFDPHSPFRVDETIYEEFTSVEPEEQAQQIAYLMNEQHITLSQYKGGEGHMYRNVSRYDTEVRFMDRELARFFTRVKERGLDDELLTVMTADHGQGLGSHDYIAHSHHIYNEQVRVPLIFHSSTGSFKPTHVENVVELVDVLPTVIGYVDGKAYTPADGTAIQGRSLLPLLTEEADAFPDKYGFSQRRVFGADTPNADWGDEFTLQNRNYKYFYRDKRPDSLYDLSKDPHELQDTVETNPEIAEKLRAMVLARIEALRTGDAVPAGSIDEQGIEKLRALGYIE